MKKYWAVYEIYYGARHGIGRHAFMLEQEDGTEVKTEEIMLEMADIYIRKFDRLEDGYNYMNNVLEVK